MSRANGIAGEALHLQRGFSWENCGKPDDPTDVKNLHVYPNPIPSPGYVIAAASATTSVHLCSPFPVNLTLEREVAGVWLKVPCVDDLGSCYYPDACVRLAQLFMLIPELCPEPKRSSSVPCGCPFRAGDYYWPSSGIYIPNFSLPNRLTNFRLQIILGNAEKELGCLKVSFSIASVLYNQHTEM
ncbi:ganglioside GM2 activator isoform X1 [Cyprinus carpio]|uniref:Ganglioside GM2 activator isoform X1 n=1 Tax=Cyprinus carpio TaxID=7962 RepID=A0A9Q9ZF55_CYPCA|nr:ganglioside GM2 activator isoform X1 [Cyprinus carpio]